jgi:hypothetical protein
MQAAKASMNADILLEELDMEKTREESKRAAAARRRERKKKKKLEKKEERRKLFFTNIFCMEWKCYPLLIMNECNVNVFVLTKLVL